MAAGVQQHDALAAVTRNSRKEKGGSHRETHQLLTHCNAQRFCSEKPYSSPPPFSHESTRTWWLGARIARNSRNSISPSPGPRPTSTLKLAGGPVRDPRPGPLREANGAVGAACEECRLWLVWPTRMNSFTLRQRRLLSTHPSAWANPMGISISAD